MKNKKSNLSIRFMILLALGVFVFVIMSFLLPKLLGSEASEATERIIGTGDFDTDGVANYFDKCKCIFADTENGCPIGVDVSLDSHSEYSCCSRENAPDWIEDDDLECPEEA